ncbi:type I polyketide synthase [Streptomyces sp. ST2-7A]|uniref:type I polyketide synthase n=1 Tax=Streptomyces sp. ST2-7A TaxID=2907214 RepID=UPI001F2D7681|nr:type I polyketide synthase [Streptomyces sp. ST2-7A]MCE7079503.1 type I polyketide synthase [Streptomyces sp. ST2-7A]
MNRIAIVGLACRYPDATTPRELWENAVAGRRAFRRLPDVRTPLADYWDPDPTAPDRFYARNAAVLEGYRFDRVAYKVPGSTYRSTDLTHWLALDTASRALLDAGFTPGGNLPRSRTGVIVGNTLTGEFTRANVMRLRWPYVHRVMARALRDEGWDDRRVAEFLAGVEDRYKEPFPPVDEDTLAGGLANTIAGRICNHFDLKGGGYTVDGACSSSLLSITTAATALLEGDIDVAVAGGVDLSIDPFEIIGFAKAGALATGEMRMYDRRSNGFWPGEGCGMVVLMREEDAVAAHHRIYAVVAGWGISSDGFGGITRPEIDGYRLALQRAYERAGFGIETVSLFEGHGTGTAVGDAAELTALSGARADADPDAPPAAITSIKGMIGHTKAAAGVAGLIKATMAVDQQVLPPTIGCVEPHEVLARPGAPLRALKRAEEWPREARRRAGVTAMGFGGINTHVVLENAPTGRRRRAGRRSLALAGAGQDCELLVFDADTPAALARTLRRTAEFVESVSYAQVADLAATLQRERSGSRHRAAAVVTSPADADRRLRELADLLDSGTTRHFSADGRALIGEAGRRGRIGFLFPGQGSVGTAGGALRRRFPEAEEVYRRATSETIADPTSTAVAQPRIVAGSVVGLRVLDTLRVEATCAVGHSLGELSALHWAGALSEDTLLEAARVRGRAMAEHGAVGAMASLAAGPEQVEQLIADLDVVVSALNGPHQTVVAGSPAGVETVAARAAARQLDCVRLQVTRAFHSPLVEPAAEVFGAWLATAPVEEPEGRVVSTITGAEPAPGTDPRESLRRQITAPVRFAEAVTVAAKEVDLFVEVGPGHVLSSLATEVTGLPAVAMDSESDSLAGLLRVVAAAHVIGAPVDIERLFDNRLLRPLEVGREFDFLVNPCERVPDDGLPKPSRYKPATESPVRAEGVTGDTTRAGEPAPPTASGVEDGSDHAAPPAGEEPPADPAGEGDENVLSLLRAIIAERAELPVELVDVHSRLLDDLHLSSISVGQIVNQAAGRLGIGAAQVPANFATATLVEVAEALEALRTTGSVSPTPSARIAGAASWVRSFAVTPTEEPLPRSGPPEGNGEWELFTTPDNRVAAEVRDRLRNAGVGPGVLACLPPECDPAAVDHVLEAAQRALTLPAGRFVLLQYGAGAAGLAKTLHQEAEHLRTTVVHAPPDALVADRVVAEVAATTDFNEVYYGPDGVRRVPTLGALPFAAERTDAPLAAGDVLLVTGGGKGISAECALAIARETGAALALLGRSDPASDRELAANLERIAGTGIPLRYARADVARPEQVTAAVVELEAALGPITGLLHGAGRNEPVPLTDLTPEILHRTFTPKVDGLRHVLDALEMSRLKLLITFGSVIGRVGLRGEAHYAAANEWLAALTEDIARSYPNLRARCVEWSVWSGVGMGEKLAVVESLAREGITPIPPEQGVDTLLRLAYDPDAPVVTVVSGRTEGIHTMRREEPPLPLLRFVGTPVIRYHGVELVTEVELNVGSDPYLADHLLDGDLLLPAVIGMEAMSQVAVAVTGRECARVIEDARFERPVVVPPNGTLRIRIAATVTGSDTVDVVLRAEDTAFAVDHFRARLVDADVPPAPGPPSQTASGTPVVALDPHRDLYGRLLFQGRRFQRLVRFHRASARHVDADVSRGTPGGWFAGYLPDRMLLADPGMRDALMHGNQVCVPDATLLPVSIERLHPLPSHVVPTGELRFCATERSRDGDTHVYDIAVRDAEDTVVERWEGLTLRAVRRTDGSGPWSPALLGPYLERALEGESGAAIAVTVEPDDGRPAGSVDERRALTAIAASRALDAPRTVRYRADGRPGFDGDGHLSSSHAAGLTLTVVSQEPVACDVESVVSRSTEDWAGLLGVHVELPRFITRDIGEDIDIAATRVWCAMECLGKYGVLPTAPLTVTRREGSAAWTHFVSGDLRVATFATRLRDTPEPVVLAFLVPGADAHERRS